MGVHCVNSCCCSGRAPRPQTASRCYLCTPPPRCYINRGAGLRTVNSKPVIQGSEAPTVPRLDFRRRRRPARQGKLKNYFRITLAARTFLGPTLLARCLNFKYKVCVSPYYTWYSRHSDLGEFQDI